MEKEKTFYQRLLEAKKEIGSVTKNAKNPHFKNTYADINAIIAEVEPILLKHDLILLQPITENRQFSIVQDALTNSKIESYLDLPSGMNPQQMGSAITYFRRYTLQSLLSLRAEDDDAQTVPTKAVTAKPTFTTSNFEKAYIAKATMAQIKAKYDISKEVEDAYINYVIEKDKQNG